MTRTLAILLALLLGIGAGLGVRAAADPTLTAVAEAALVGGQLWVRALQMTLIPLIFAMATHSVARAVSGGRGALIGKTLLLFFGIMAVTVALCTALVETALHLWPLPPDALAGLIPEGAAPAPTGLGKQLLAILPDNPIAAAAQGQIFPLVVFAMAFGIAIARTAPIRDGGEPAILVVLAQIAHAMLRIVDWVLVVAPAGIFLLALGLGLSSGLGIARVLGMFVALSFVTAGGMALLCYLVVYLSRSVPIARFALGILPAQAMAAGSSSSMATTPVMIEVAIEKLGISEDVVGLVIPMAVAIFRLGTVAHAVAAVLVAAHAVGIEPSLLQLGLAGLAVILGSVSGAGLPGAAVIYAIYGPGIQLLGAPMAIMPLYLAVIALPDPIITLSTVTGNLTVTALASRMLPGRGGAQSSG